MAIDRPHLNAGINVHYVGNMMEMNDVEFTVLYRAIKRADIAFIRNALESGTSPDLTDTNGWTLLMIAAHKGAVEIGRLLIGAGADINRLTTDHPSGFPPHSALSTAIIQGHIAFVQLLRENGVDLDAGMSAEAWLSKSYHLERIFASIDALVQAHRARTASATPESL